MATYPTLGPAMPGTWATGAARFSRQLLQGLSFLYAFFAFGVSGIPGLARSALICAGCIWGVILLSARGPWDRPYFRFAGLFGLVALANAICVSDPVNSLTTLGMLTTALLGAVGCCYACEQTHTTKHILYGVLAGCALNIAAIYAGLDVLQSSADAGRATGLTGNANALAVRFFLASFLIWTVAERVPPFFFICSIILPAYALLTTGSRKTMLMLPLLVMAALMRLMPRHWLLVVAASLLLACGGLFAASQHLLPDVIQDSLALKRLLQITEWKTESSISIRHDYAERGIALWAKSPLFGHGLGQFASLSGADTYSHNNYTELLVSGGVILLGAYYVIHLYLATRSLRRRTWPVVVLVASLIIVDIAMVSYYDKTSWLVLTLAFLSPCTGSAKHLFTGFIPWSTTHENCLPHR